MAIAGNAQDKIQTRNSLGIGIDLSPLIITAFEPERVGFGVSLDYKFEKNFFAVIEGGLLNYNIKHTAYNYKLNGIYALAGVDYNVLKDEIRVDNDILFVGLRYGFSSFQHETENITMGNYWGNFVGSFENQQLYAHWVEMTGGLKAELFFAKNIFIGWTLRAKILLPDKNNKYLEPYIIPGYGKTEKSFRFGISWFISYRIPFKKRS